MEATNCSNLLNVLIFVGVVVAVVYLMDDWLHARKSADAADHIGEPSRKTDDHEEL